MSDAFQQPMEGTCITYHPPTHRMHLRNTCSHLALPSKQPPSKHPASKPKLCLPPLHLCAVCMVQQQHQSTTVLRSSVTEKPKQKPLQQQHTLCLQHHNSRATPLVNLCNLVQRPTNIIHDASMHIMTMRTLLLLLSRYDALRNAALRYTHRHSKRDNKNHHTNRHHKERHLQQNQQQHPRQMGAP